MKYQNDERLFDKDDKIYCLLSSQSKPEILIPIKARIVDVQWDSVNPLYKVQILEFFEKLDFLEKHFMEMGFRYTFENSKIKRPKIESVRYKNIDEFTRLIQLNDENIFVVDSLMCAKSKEQLNELFEGIQFYIISNHFKELRMQMGRLMLKGPFALNKFDFNKKFSDNFSERFKKYNIPITKYLDSL